MPHSPLLQTVHAPITNIGDYEDEIRQYRAELDRGENNKYAQSELTDLAETLVERCKFLNSKLIVKQDDIRKLKLENSKLREKIQEVEDSKAAGSIAELSRE
ncbi:hypothetical protein LTR12_018415 [Friedmanniomyces endolithicus]|nr:hypothetical protein LTR12_018415 [Friedmanniomyces endolithicus]